jgi:predicted nucleic acid-binding protein
LRARWPAPLGGTGSRSPSLGFAGANRQRVIGGRVLDASALVAFARGISIYAAAAVWTAVEESIVLIVPSTAVAAAWAELVEQQHRSVLDVLLHLPVTIIDNLDEARARAVGELGGHQADAHAIACAQERGWPLLTAQPARYDGYEQTGVDFESVI